MLVRAWNVFHGNTLPPGRHTYLREMVELVTADRPGIVCLQEVPPWAFDHVGEWAGMQAFSACTRRPKLGPIGSHELDHLAQVRPPSRRHGVAVEEVPAPDEHGALL